jgi:hypothetical protein
VLQSTTEKSEEDRGKTSTSLFFENIRVDHGADLGCFGAGSGSRPGLYIIAYCRQHSVCSALYTGTALGSWSALFSHHHILLSVSPKKAPPSFAIIRVNSEGNNSATCCVVEQQQQQ